MLSPDTVAAKVNRASTWLDDAARVFARPLPELLADDRARDLACFYLMLAIQECADLAAAWVASEGWTPPDSAGAAFDVLAGHGVIDPALAAGMRGAVGIRHRIAHGYAGVDVARLHAEAPVGIASIREFLEVAGGE